MGGTLAADVARGSTSQKTSLVAILGGRESDLSSSEVLCGGHSGLQGPKGPRGVRRGARARSAVVLDVAKENARAWEWSQRRVAASTARVVSRGPNNVSKRTAVAARLVFFKSGENEEI